MSQEDATRELVDSYWDDLVEIEPLLATQVGDERFDDRLPDPSEAGRAQREQLQRHALESLAGLDRDATEPVLRTTLDVMEAIARRDLAWLEFRFDRLEAVSHLWGAGQLLAELGSMQRADTPERMARYLARLRAVPTYLAAVEDLAREGAGAGQTVPAVVADRAIAQLERLIDLPIDESPALAVTPELSPADREGVSGVLREVVMPAYERYLTCLREYRPAATETLGLYALPDGEAMYRAAILAWTTLDLEAQKVHDLGVEDLERIQVERRQIAEGLGFADPESAIADLMTSGRNTATSREQMLRLAEEQVRRGWDAAPGFFERLPSSNCEVRAVEEFREADMPAAFYQPPTDDGTRPGIYYVNTSDLDERHLHHMATTTYHEANPGHHFQLALEQEMTDRPALRRFGGILAGSAFVEGWGLYSERLADEMGLFTDDFERLGMLDTQGLRAARLIVDTGIHAFAWDRDRAIAKLEEAGMPHMDAVIEVDRYISLPGQALSYKIGQIEIERWRTEAAKRQGADFSLPDFHDRLLSLGSLPLPSLQRELGA